MHLVVGLGNPGARYERTRHNVGFDVVGELAKRAGTELKEKRFNGRIGKGQLVLQPVWLAQPQTWMNRSGDCVGPMAGYFKIPPARVVVIHDELDLPFGVVKVKLGVATAGTTACGTSARSWARAPSTHASAWASADPTDGWIRPTGSSPSGSRGRPRTCRSSWTGPRTRSNGWSGMGWPTR